jgi:alpha-D-ribose 1-methylphosphonate 5-triphosphate diphosphatase
LPRALDCAGDWLIPGLVEVHTDNFERHLLPRPRVRWAELPAWLAHDAEIAAAGITTVLDAMGIGDTTEDSLRSSDMTRILQTLEEAAARDLLRADHWLHARCEVPAPNALELFQPFAEHPRLALLSLMDHTPGQRQWEDIAHARVYYVGKKGWTEERFQQELALAGEYQARYAVPQRQYFVEYARQRQLPLASHDDTTVGHVLEASAEGVSISEFPTTRLAAQAAREHGMVTVMGAPNVVRGGSHSGNVAAASLASLGLLDILSSDYVPGSLLTAVLRLADLEVMPLPAALATVTVHPARAIGLQDRGRLESGLRADLVQVRVVKAPDGQRQAVVRAVWREGRRVL